GLVQLWSVGNRFCCYKCGLQNQTEHLTFSKAGVCVCQETEVYLGRRCTGACGMLSPTP
uniref:Uncharacterized protein n=1 Tax=Bubo bubo TaxID=30461 RepID=A0A8C0EJA2_BUBBB